MKLLQRELLSGFRPLAPRDAPAVVSQRRNKYRITVDFVPGQKGLFPDYRGLLDDGGGLVRPLVGRRALDADEHPVPVTPFPAPYFTVASEPLLACGQSGSAFHDGVREYTAAGPTAFVEIDIARHVHASIRCRLGYRPKHRVRLGCNVKVFRSAPE